MLRILKDHSDAQLIIKPTSKHFGRSLYLCYNNDCLKTALKKKSLQRLLKRTIEPEFIEAVEKEIAKN